MKIKNIISTFSFFLFSIIINSQVTIQDGNIIQEGVSEELAQQKSSNNANDFEMPIQRDPSSPIDNLTNATINQSNGKVNYSVPITEISSNRLKVGISLRYSGNDAIKNVEYSNKIKPTSTVGLGWNINTSKIITDNKQTGYRDDDEFFLSEGGLKRLICTKKRSAYIYDFKVENLPNWNVTYYKNNNYWLIIKDNGDQFFYGNSDPSIDNNSNENIIHWNNWIGDSRAEGGTLQTSIWNLSKISNQWNDQIQFYYETTEQGIQINNLGPKHTEASYLERIESSSGDKIELNYLNKINTASIQEYYEPHTEISEPDAYQEHYETKHLDNIVLKSNDEKTLMRYKLDYEVHGTSLFAKRYLTQITTYNSSNESLNPQVFRYNTDGVFKGTIYKIKNTMGSEVTYDYKNKFLYTNEPNLYNEDFFNDDNFDLSYITGAAPSVKNNFFIFKKYNKILVFTRKGSSWKTNEITLNSPITRSNFFGENYFGFMSGSDNKKLEIIYLDNDGDSWKKQTLPLPIEKDPDKPWSQHLTYIAKEKYILIISSTGKIIPVIKTGSNFSVSDSFDFPNSEIDDLIGRNDHFWFTTKNPEDRVKHSNVINDVSQTYNHYVLSYQQDKSFRLETIYPNPSASPKSGSYHLDPGREEFLNLSDIQLSTSQFSNKFSFNRIFRESSENIKYFSGNQWINGPSSSGTFTLGANKSFRTYWNNTNGFDRRIYSELFDPNFETFITSNQQSLGNGANLNLYSPHIIGEYDIDYTSIHKNNTTSREFIEHYDTGVGSFIESDLTFDKLLHRKGQNKCWYFYIDNKNGLLKKIKLESQFPSLNLSQSHSLSDNYFIDKSYAQYGVGYYGLKIYNLYENEFGQDVYDIVVKSININNGNDQNVSTEYIYNSSFTIPNFSTYYGEVIIEKKGVGTSSIGQTFNYYNTGEQDIRKAGLLEKTVIKNTGGKIVAQNYTNVEISNDLYVNNSVNTPIFIGNRLLQDKKTTQSFFYDGSQPNPSIITTIEEFEYNDKGLIKKSSRTNSKGLKEEQHIKYAYENSNAFENTNMINAVAKRTSIINDKIVGVTIAEWVNDKGRLYPKKEYSGPSETDVRLNSEITKISNKGVVQETTNGKDLFAVNLSAYNNTRSVASIDNAHFSDVINNLDVTYDQLQNLDNDQLKVELLKLYDRLPEAMIKLSFYDDKGNIISEIDARQEEIKYYYDSFSRLDYTTDSNDKVLKKNVYNYKTN